MKHKKIILITLLIIILLVVIIFFAKSSEADSKSNTSEEICEVTNQTIITTLTASGEVESAKEEKIALNTNLSYLTMCAEKEEYVKQGDNLLEYTNGTYITAPYDCVLVEYSVPEAKSRCASENYIYIASVDELYMNISITEEDLKNVSVNQEVEIVANYDEAKVYKGTIIKINDIGEVSNGGTKFVAIAKIENDGNLKLGMSATCTITIEKSENVLSVPVEAVTIENNKKYVNKIKDNNEVEKICIETGKADANYVEVKSGLSLGDKIKYEKVIEQKEETKEKNETKSITSILGGGENPMDRRGGYNR